MLEKAFKNAQVHNIENCIEWSIESYQSFIASNQDRYNSYDLILCHALIEWLEQPEKLIAQLKKMLTKEGLLSLCFYNPSGLVFRNLIHGNFKMATTTFDMKPDIGSLTPRQPSSTKQIRQWLDKSNFSIKQASGIRVFNDYVMNKRGGNLIPEEVIKMELEFSRQEPFVWIARYIHLLCHPTTG